MDFIRYLPSKTVSAVHFIITESSGFQLHFISKTHHFRFTLTYSSFNNLQDATHATTHQHAAVQQASVSQAHLSNTLISISLSDIRFRKLAFTFLGKISVFDSIDFQYLFKSKSETFSSINITACGFHILAG